MDGPNLYHSDSDSGESWTLLDKNPSFAEDASECPHASTETYNNDRDEDTDGISIISDSDHEHMSAIDINETDYAARPHNEENTTPDFFEQTDNTINTTYQKPLVSTDNEINDSNGKVKTYVHRRNKRLSTVLNIIMLGSVITAAGVAIGHTWGARNDCSLHYFASVNKILSNLYKLQEENALLRKKLRELAFVNSIQTYPKTSEEQKMKNNRCKKVFEDTLSNKDSEMFVKCVDDFKTVLSSPSTPEIEKEFLNDLKQLENVYQHNKWWLDEEIKSRIKHELKVKMKNDSRLSKNVPEKRSKLDVPIYKTKEPANNNKDMHSALEPKKVMTEYQDIKIEVSPTKTLKYESFNPQPDFPILDKNFIEMKEQKLKIHNIKDLDTIWAEFSETDLGKDDRYNKNKHKHEKKKHDRPKSYKKQKRRNKYEQWEMKGGYLRDYDDISIPSSLENEYIMKNNDKNSATRNFEKNNYLNQFSEELDVQKQDNKKDIKTENHMKEINWYEKRATSRKHARKKLEKELFGDSYPNTSAWYFRRMQKREQCRLKGDNSTHKKILKRNKNFKMKH